MTFNLKIDIEADGEASDQVYDRLCTKLFEIDGVTDVSELQTPTT